MTQQKPCGTFRRLVTLRRTLAILCVAMLPTISWAAPFAYVANYNSNNVSVIDTASNTVAATVAVGSNPYAVSVNLAGTRVYVTNLNGNSVSVIDTTTNTVTATVAVGGNPFGVAVNPTGTRVYVTKLLSNSVSVIDTTTNTVTATVVVGSEPIGVAVNPNGTRVYVANSGSSGVSVIDTASNTVTATVAVGTNPNGVSINPAGTRVYVPNNGSDSVSVIDTTSNTVTATVAVGSQPIGVSVNPAGTRVYVANNGGNSVSVIDATTNTVAASVGVGTQPYGISVNPAGTRVYVANHGSNSVSVIDTASSTVTSTLAVGAASYNLGNFIGPDAAVPAVTDPIPPLIGVPAVPGISSQLVALDLASGQGPAMTNCLLATVRNLLGADAQYLGQSTNGVAKFSLSGGRLMAFYPVQASTFAGQTNDIHLTGSNVLNVGTSCGNFNVTPALYSLNDFGSIWDGMGLKAGISAQGVMTLLVGNTVYVARPDYLASGSTGGATSPRLAQGSDGLYRLTDSAGNVQILRSAFVDTDGLPSAVQAMLSLGGSTTIQTDGTAVFTAFNGTQYVLTPDLTLTVASQVNAALYWWQDGPSHYMYRSNLLTLAQGFMVQQR